jgi:hypothetical protein
VLKVNSWLVESLISRIAVVVERQLLSGELLQEGGAKCYREIPDVAKRHELSV